MKLEDEMAARPWGLLIAGDRYTYKANNQTATGRTATAVYHRLTDDRCFVTGCSGEICSDLQDVNSTCEWKPEYACYASATCERQPDGLCGWTETPELTACLEASGSFR